MIPADLFFIIIASMFGLMIGIFYGLLKSFRNMCDNRLHQIEDRLNLIQNKLSILEMKIDSFDIHQLKKVKVEKLEEKK